MEKDAIDLGSMNVYRLFRKFFFPTLLGMLGMCAVTAIDGIFVGHGVGSDGIAAVNICVPIYMLCNGLGLMLGIGCSVVASIHLAHGKVKAARLNVSQSVIFSSIITIALSLLICLYPEKTARLLGSSDELMQMVCDYLVWFVPAIVFEVWVSIALFILRLDGSPKLAMWCSLITAIINTILDWLFIFPFGWGVMGAAFASALSVVAGGVIAMAYMLFFAKTLRMIKIKWSRRSLYYSIRNVRYQCTIGSSGFIGEITLAVLVFVGNHVFLQYLGNDGVGAFGIACYYTPFAFMVGNAIAQSAQPIISFNYGLHLFDRQQQALKAALITSVMCGVCVTLMFTFFPHWLVGLFIDPDCNAAQIAINGFPYFSTGFVFFIINLTFVGYYQSIERVKNATTLSILRGFVFLIPAFYIMPILLGTKGIWIALSVSEIATTIIILVWEVYSNRRDKR